MSNTSKISSFVEWGRKVVAIGRNYRDHCAELNNAIPRKPILFLKSPSSYHLEGRGPILVPRGCTELHHEVELGVVIGKAGTDISETEAFRYIAGYALTLDMTARDFQSEAKKKGHPWTLAKCFDTSLPVSRFITHDELNAPEDASIWCKVNGTLRQNGTTSNMIFSIPYLLSYVSQYISLYPGDLILTGTPAGVGAISPGSTISCGINEILTMEFKVERRS